MENTKLKSAKGTITLMGIKGLGPATVNKLTDRFDTLGEILNSDPDDLKGLATAPIRKTLTDGGKPVTDAFRKAEHEFSRAEDIGVEIVSIHDDHYPARLRQIKDAPKVLYVAGNLSVLEKSVACVGTRDPNEFGSVVTDRITSMLAESGWTIVSGLARGVDRISHEAALKNTCPTAAIIGSGIDTFASSAAMELAEKIVSEGGLVISEQPMGKDADPSSLIRRNRIQTGASVATVIMQAFVESGTMHSVRYAVQQGRPLYAPAVPEAFHNDDLNKAAIALTTMSPMEFGDLIHANEALFKAISEIPSNTVATAIRGRDFYPSMICQLESALSKDMTADQPRHMSM